MSDPRLRFLLWFALALGVELAIVVWAFDRQLDPWLNRATARSTASALSLLGVECQAQGELVTCASLSSVRIIFECTAAFPLGIFLAAVLAFPSRWGWKVVGMAAGAPAILLLNLVRVMSLVWLGARYPLWADWLHIVLWQSAMIVFVALLWLLWASWGRRRTRHA